MAKHKQNNAFLGTSFLDLLACALGGVLLLLLMTMHQSRQQVSTLEEEITDMVQHVSAIEEEIQGMERHVSAVVGLKGEFEGVVFVFDTSGSMADDERFEEYQQMLQQWLMYLPFDRFNVIDFDSGVKPWRPDVLVTATAAEREAACQFVEGFTAGGSTNTLGALQAAFAMPGVDTIILMSDGAPDKDQPMDQIHDWLARENKSRGVVINTVGMGLYFDKAYGPFLQKIASDHGGMFIGR